jgi:hypothetical protein
LENKIEQAFKKEHGRDLAVEVVFQSGMRVGSSSDARRLGKLLDALLARPSRMSNSIPGVFGHAP